MRVSQSLKGVWGRRYYQRGIIVNVRYVICLGSSGSLSYCHLARSVLTAIAVGTRLVAIVDHVLIEGDPHMFENLFTFAVISFVSER